MRITKLLVASGALSLLTQMWTVGLVGNNLLGIFLPRMESMRLLEGMAAESSEFGELTEAGADAQAADDLEPVKLDRQPVRDGTGIAASPLLPPVSPAARPERRPTSLFDTEEVQREPMATVSIKIDVPHARRAVDHYTVYPYPVRPPKQVTPIKPISLKYGHLKSMLLNSGYHQRTNGEKPFPTGGWRWQYCFNRAMRKSGETCPHTLLTMYKWADRMVPYVAEEVRISNEYEKERESRYHKAVYDWEKHHEELENEAVRQGLTPIRFRSRPNGTAVGAVPAGQWWVTVTRKLPALTYYWLLPVSTASGAKVDMTLTESNAVLITGHW